MPPVQPKEHPAGKYYTAVAAGHLVEVWDSDVMLFAVPVCLAAHQDQRDALAALWDRAIEQGKSEGREKMKQDLRRLIGAASR
jgi:hypothetical protein